MLGRLFTLFCLFISFLNFSQTAIKGSVIGSEEGQTPYCTVAVFNSIDSSIVKGTIANDLGEFEFESLRPGTYYLMVRYTYYKNYYSEQFEYDSIMPIDFGKIQLEPNETLVDEVQVIALKQTVQFEAGKVVLNVENDVLSSGNSALDLLKRIPGVTVDAKNNVSVNGKSGVRFLMNGRLQQVPHDQMMTLLGNMSSEFISKMELITNPPSKYDASGTGGLINIITRKAKVKGFEGSISNNFSIGKGLINTAGINLNYKSNRLSVFTSLSHSYKNIITASFMDRSLNTQTMPTTINAEGGDSTRVSVMNARVGLEYGLSAKTVIGLDANYGFNTADRSGLTNTLIDGVNPFGYDEMTSKLGYIDNYQSPSGSLYLIHTLDTLGSEISIGADYTYYTQEWINSNRNNFFASNGSETLPPKEYRNSNDLTFNISTQNLDYTKCFSPALTLQAGLKSSQVRTESGFLLERNDVLTQQLVADNTFSNEYNYNEQIYAGYISLQKMFKRVSLQAGIRPEYTNVNGISKSNGYRFTNSYLNIFPSFAAFFQQNEKNSFQLSYSYRIERPLYNQLNPVRTFLNELSYEVGNPELSPQYSHNIDLGFNRNNMISNSISFIALNKSVYNYSFTNAQSNINVDTLINFSSKSMLSYNLYIQKAFKNKYRFQFNSAFAYFANRGTINETSINKDILALQASLNGDLLLPAKFSLHFFLSYISPFRDGFQLLSQKGTFDFAVQKKLMNDRMKIVLSFTDIFYTNFSTISTDLVDQSYYYLTKQDSRRVRLNVVYNFGKMQISKRRGDDESRGSRIRKEKN